MYDMHSHILPDIDDGAKTEKESQELIRLAAERGSSTIVATPHVIEYNKHPSWQQILALTSQAREGFDNITICPGAEVMMNWELLEIYKEAPGAFCLNETRYALVELPMYHVPSYADDFWYQMQMQGLVPVLAHPERYLELWETPDRLLDWVKKGILLQINCGSLIGRFGSREQKNAELLLEKGLVSFAGSDAHDIKYLKTDIGYFKEAVACIAGEDYAQEICEIIPAKVLADEDVCAFVPKGMTLTKKRSLWAKLFG